MLHNIKTMKEFFFVVVELYILFLQCYSVKVCNVLFLFCNQ